MGGLPQPVSHAAVFSSVLPMFTPRPIALAALHASTSVAGVAALACAAQATEPTAAAEIMKVAASTACIQRMTKEWVIAPRLARSLRGRKRGERESFTIGPVGRNGG